MAAAQPYRWVDEVKRHWIEFADEPTAGPMTHWVHTGPHGRSTRAAGQTPPPMPGPVPGRGFALLHVEYQGFTFTFASLDELDLCVDTLSRRVLPTSIRLSAEHGSGAGPNSHWLSRLPARVTSWKYREGAAAYLRKARLDFELQLQAT